VRVDILAAASEERIVPQPSMESGCVAEALGRTLDGRAQPLGNATRIADHAG
jgi:hypothetical protein